MSASDIGSLLVLVLTVAVFARFFWLRARASAIIKALRRTNPEADVRRAQAVWFGHPVAPIAAFLLIAIGAALSASEGSPVQGWWWLPAAAGMGVVLWALKGRSG